MAADRNSHDLLSRVHVAKPCPADWKEMRGDLTVRHCTHCNKNVYNISRMTRAEAVRLIEDNEGRVCVRYYMRADGSVMTKDCPKIIVHRGQFAKVLVSLFALFGLLMGVAGDIRHSNDSHSGKSNPITGLADRIMSMLGLSRFASAPAGSDEVVGKIAVKMPTSPPAPVVKAPPVMMGSPAISPAPSGTPHKLGGK